MKPEPIEVRVKVTVEGPQEDRPDPGWAEWICETILAGAFDADLEEILEAAHHRKREVRGHCR